VSGGVASHILNLGTDGGEWSASCPGCYPPQKKSPWYPLDRRLGFRAGLDMAVKRKKFLPCTCQELNPGCPSCNLVTILTELPWLI